MRKRLAKLPSPAMAVAFVALIAALTGTAVALPGSNTVTSGDIKRGAVGTSDIRNNSVRSGDIRNSTVRGRDVRNNTLTGADINESSLGTVPSASAANAANFANASVISGTAQQVAHTKVSGLARAGDDQRVTLLSHAGFRIELVCDQDALDTESGDEGEIVIINVNAGDGSVVDGDEDAHDDTFDEGESEPIVATTSHQEVGHYSALGTKGGGVSGIAHIVEDDGDFTDCAGKATGSG